MTSQQQKDFMTSQQQKDFMTSQQQKDFTASQQQKDFTAMIQVTKVIARMGELETQIDEIRQRSALSIQPLAPVQEPT